MHIHICPVEIAAALDFVRQGLPYMKMSWCYHVENIKDKIHERKCCENAEENEGERQEIEEGLEVTDTESTGTGI